MLKNIETSDIFHRYEQVIFIAHSMGGLIVKDMMVRWQASDNADTAYLPRIIGVLLLGVPSQGSPVASDPETVRYAIQTTFGNRFAATCPRQVRDLFAGSGNTYLHDLEDKWTDVLTTRRRNSRSEAPRVGCAHETGAEPIFYGQLSTLIVPELYAVTQCDLGNDAIGVSHTQLPKPANMGAAVHQAWLRSNLDKIFTSWSQWPFVRVALPPGRDTLAAFAKAVNNGQYAFNLTIGDSLRTFAPRAASYEGPTYFAAVSKMVVDNPQLCMETNWTTAGPAQTVIKPDGQCHSQ